MRKDNLKPQDRVIETNTYGKVIVYPSKTAHGNPCVDVIDFETDEFVTEIEGDIATPNMDEDDLVELVEMG